MFKYISEIQYFVDFSIENSVSVKIDDSSRNWRKRGCMIARNKEMIIYALRSFSLLALFRPKYFLITAKPILRSYITIDRIMPNRVL